jgi:hypothetical protein
VRVYVHSVHIYIVHINSVHTYRGVHQKIKKFARGSRYDFHMCIYIVNEDMKSKICEIKHTRRYLMLHFD